MIETLLLHWVHGLAAGLFHSIWLVPLTVGTTFCVDRVLPIRSPRVRVQIYVAAMMIAISVTAIATAVQLHSAATLWTTSSSHDAFPSPNWYEKRAVQEWRYWLVAFWIVGASGVIWNALYNKAKIIRVTEQTRTWDDRLKALGAPPELRVRSAKAGHEICVVGMFRPTLIISDHAARLLSPAQTDAVLAHELAHLTRRDPALRGFALLFVAGFFYHPAAWVLLKTLYRSQEEASDIHAVSSGADRHSLAQAIAVLSEKQLSVGSALVTPVLTRCMPTYNRIKTLLLKDDFVLTKNRPGLSVSLIGLPGAILMLSFSAMTFQAAKADSIPDRAEATMLEFAELICAEFKSRKFHLRPEFRRGQPIEVRIVEGTVSVNGVSGEDELQKLITDAARRAGFDQHQGLYLRYSSPSAEVQTIAPDGSLKSAFYDPDNYLSSKPRRYRVGVQGVSGLASPLTSR